MSIKYLTESLSLSLTEVRTTSLIPREEPNYYTYEDHLKNLRVEKWVHVLNPVIATCRRCRARDLMDDPEIGLYGKRKVYIEPPKSIMLTFEKISIETEDRRHEPPVIRPGDYEQLSKVTRWVPVTNPMYGTCRHCGHRGLVDHPCIGLF